MMTEEKWAVIPEFPKYQISTSGRVYNTKYNSEMRTSENGFGYLKITLTSDWDRFRYTRSVAQLVAEAFVESPSPLCDHVMILDGNLLNVTAENLAWRPRWFVWKYTHQLKIEQPIHYHNLQVRNLETDVVYGSVIDAGMIEGLLFDDIWRSTYTGAAIYPYGWIFEVVK